MERLLRAVEKEMEHKDGGWAVEDIQDAVERVLMENGRYEEAKRYILYRHRRNEQRAARRAMAQAAGVPALDGVLAKIEKDFPGEAYALTVLNTKFQSFVKPGMGADAGAGGAGEGGCGADGARRPRAGNSSRRACSMHGLAAAWRSSCASGASAACTTSCAA